MLVGAVDVGAVGARRCRLCFYEDGVGVGCRNNRGGGGGGGG